MLLTSDALVATELRPGDIAVPRSGLRTDVVDTRREVGAGAAGADETGT
jgi:hypothetical protein